MEPKPQPAPETPEKGYDPFSYPRLFPSGWNLNEPSASPEAQPMPEDYDKFHEPRTFPKGWDLE